MSKALSISTAALAISLLGSSAVLSQTTAYVATAAAANATLINTEDFTTSELTRTGGQMDIAVTSDGRFAYLAVGSLLAVVDVAADTLVGYINTAARGVAITPDDKFVYVATDEARNDVAVVDTETNTIVAMIAVTGRGPKDVVITPDGAFAYVSSNESAFVAAIEVASNIVVAEINVGVSPDGLCVTPDGRFVYAAVNLDDTVAKIEVATNTLANTFGGVGGQPTSVVVTPDGSKLYVAGVEDSTVTVVDAGPDTVLTSVNAGARNHRGIAVTPDGKHVYVTNLNASTVTVIDAETDEVVTMIPVGGSPRQLTIGPRAVGGDPTASEGMELPEDRFRLLTSAPNPFIDRTRISFELDEQRLISIEVFDVQGRLVRTLSGGWMPEGSQTVAWDGTDDYGEQVSSGAYIIRLLTSGRVETGLVIRIK